MQELELVMHASAYFPPSSHKGNISSSNVTCSFRILTHARMSLATWRLCFSAPLRSLLACLCDATRVQHAASTKVESLSASCDMPVRLQASTILETPPLSDSAGLFLVLVPLHGFVACFEERAVVDFRRRTLSSVRQPNKRTRHSYEGVPFMNCIEIR